MHIAVAVPWDKLDYLTGPVKIEIRMPKGGPEFWVEPLYAGYFTEEGSVVVDEDKTWYFGGTNDLKVEVVVPARSDFEVRATAWGSSVKPKLSEGRSNVPFNIKQTMAP